MAKKIKRIPLRQLLATIATLLEAPRDRLGRLDIYAGDSGGTRTSALRLHARETIRELAVENCLTLSHDTLEQIAKVIRIHITEKKK